MNNKAQSKIRYDNDDDDDNNNSNNNSYVNYEQDKEMWTWEIEILIRKTERKGHFIDQGLDKESITVNPTEIWCTYRIYLTWLV